MAGRRHGRLRLSRAAGGMAAGMVLAVTAACGGHAPAPHPSASSRPGGLQGESAGQVLQQVKSRRCWTAFGPDQRRINGAGRKGMGGEPTPPAGPSSSLACPALARAQRPGCWRTRDGCVVQLLVNVDENGVLFDLAGVNRDGATGKHADSLAGGQVVA